MKTPFYELAEKIADDMERHHHVTYEVPVKYYYFFEECFPELLYTHWDGRMKRSQVLAINQTALLFADLLWQEEMKGGKK